MNIKIFIVYHESLNEENIFPNYEDKYVSDTFVYYGVNEIFNKDIINKYNCRNILEYQLPEYNPFLQKRGYMETSAYLHIYWNKLHSGLDFIGICQYDMAHKHKYENLQENTIYVFGFNQYIVRNNIWNPLMYPQQRDLDFLIRSYNKYFNKNYNSSSLNNLPLSLCQTNIYPIKIFEKLCAWMEILVDEIYPSCTQTPYKAHWGTVGGYTERAIAIFNAFEVVEGKKYADLQITHNAGKRIQYNKNHYLNVFDQNINSSLKDNIISSTHHNKVANIQNSNGLKDGNYIVKNTIKNISYFYYIKTKNNNICYQSKPILLFFPENNDFNLKTIGNILFDNLERYDSYFHELGDSAFQLYIELNNKKLCWDIKLNLVI